MSLVTCLVTNFKVLPKQYVLRTSTGNGYVCTVLSVRVRSRRSQATVDQEQLQEKEKQTL